MRSYSEDGVDLTLIRWMLSLTPAERLQVLQEQVKSIQILQRKWEQKSETQRMKRITSGNYKKDKYYSRIVQVVNECLQEGDVIAPVEVLVRMGKLSKEDLENWRFGRVPYLEKVLKCNLNKASRILRIFWMHAHDLYLKPSHTAYVKRGKGRRIPLRFSKSGSPVLEEVYSHHFVRQKTRPKVKEKNTSFDEAPNANPTN